MCGNEPLSRFVETIALCDFFRVHHRHSCKKIALFSNSAVQLVAVLFYHFESDLMVKSCAIYRSLQGEDVGKLFEQCSIVRVPVNLHVGFACGSTHPTEICEFLRVAVLAYLRIEESACHEIFKRNTKTVSLQKSGYAI